MSPSKKLQPGRSLLPLKRHMGADNRNYLSPLAVFKLNRILQEILDELGIKAPAPDESPTSSTTWVVPYLFDHYRRSWHFSCVLPSAWAEIADGNRGDPPPGPDHPVFTRLVLLLWDIAIAPNPGGQQFEEMRSNLRLQFNLMKYQLLEGDAIASAYDLVAGAIEKLRTHRESCNLCKNSKDKSQPTPPDCASGILQKEGRELLRAALLVYHGLRLHRGMYLPGIMYRALCRQPVGTILDRFVGGACDQETDNKLRADARIYPVFGRTFARSKDVHQQAFGPGVSVPGRASKKDLSMRGWDKQKTITWPPARAIGIALRLAGVFYLEELAEEQGENQLDFVMLPIHDVWLGNRGYGGLWGALLCSFPKADSRNGSHRDKFIKTHLPQLRVMSEVLASELALSTLATINDLPIQPPYDLVEHFVRSIIHFQDWERVSVYQFSGDEERKLLYRYRRTFFSPEPEQNDSQLCDGWLFDGSSSEDELRDYAWILCDCKANKNCEVCEVEIEHEFHPPLRWQPKSVWDREILPALNAEECARFCDIALEFDYPATAAIPPQGNSGDDTREIFELATIEQQLEVLSTLIPRVRARRAALRSAVSAIMGRNMSHNIGSHVLARYGTQVIKDLKDPNPNKADHRGDFLFFLQQRMDFLAEVATSDQSFWSQAMSMDELVGRMNFEEQYWRFWQWEECSTIPGAGKTFDRWPVVLSYITGKESLRATVEFARKDAVDLKRQQDCWISCPSGAVGAHAFYIILENIIRNSARHNPAPEGEGDGFVRIYVSVEDEPEYADFFTVKIRDPRTSVDPKDKDAVHHRVNAALATPMIDAAGEALPENWGVREMQICAHFLRGLALSDLEGRLDAGAPAVIEAGDFTDSDGKTCLEYTFYVPRARRLAIGIADESKFSEAEFPRKELGGRGILLMPLPTNGSREIDWQAAAEKVRGYDFFLVDVAVSLELTPAQKAALPVRTLPAASNWIGYVVKTALAGPCAANGATSAEGSVASTSWQELLHRKMAETTRDLHDDDAWKGKALHGVLISKNEALKLAGAPPLPVWPQMDQKDGLQFAKKGVGRDKPFGPGDDEEAWLNRLSGAALGVAWVDHISSDDIQTGFGGLGQSSEFPDPIEDDARNWISVEGAFSDSMHSNFLSHCRDGEGWEILAASVPRVVVLDERVQSASDRKLRGGITTGKMWPLMGVWVPPRPTANSGLPACDLDRPNMDSIHKFLEQPAVREDQYPVDFLIIHLTILERLQRENGTSASLSEKLEELVKGTPAAAAQVVIVTGRGVPSVSRRIESDGVNHLSRARYLPISALLECLVTRPSKLALMRVIWSAARPREIGGEATQ